MKAHIIISGLAAGLATALLPLHVKADGCCAPPVVLAQAVEQGLAKQTKTLKVEISGMECARCSASINAALSKVDGVIESDITFEKKGGTVEYHPSKVDEKKIVDAINTMGFKANPSKS